MSKPSYQEQVGSLQGYPRVVWECSKKKKKKNGARELFSLDPSFKQTNEQKSMSCVLVTWKHLDLLSSKGSIVHSVEILFSFKKGQFAIN